MKPNNKDEGLSEEELAERISEEGECVFWHRWDAREFNMLGEKGVDWIYKFRDQYWCHCNEDGLHGPYETFAEAMEKSNFGIIDATQSISCSELTADELAAGADFFDPKPGHRVEINGDEWEVSSDGRLKRAGEQKAGYGH